MERRELKLKLKEPLATLKHADLTSFMKDARTLFPGGRLMLRGEWPALQLGQDGTFILVLPLLGEHLECQALVERRLPEGLILKVSTWARDHQSRLWRFTALAWAFMRETKHPDFMGRMPPAIHGLELGDIIYLGAPRDGADHQTSTPGVLRLIPSAPDKEAKGDAFLPPASVLESAKGIPPSTVGGAQPGDEAPGFYTLKPPPPPSHPKEPDWERLGHFEEEDPFRDFHNVNGSLETPGPQTPEPPPRDPDPLDGRLELGDAPKEPRRTFHPSWHSDKDHDLDWGLDLEGEDTSEPSFLGDITQGEGENPDLAWGTDALREGTSFGWAEGSFDDNNPLDWTSQDPIALEGSQAIVDASTTISTPLDSEDTATPRASYGGADDTQQEPQATEDQGVPLDPWEAEVFNYQADFIGKGRPKASAGKGDTPLRDVFALKDTPLSTLLAECLMESHSRRITTRSHGCHREIDVIEGEVVAIRERPRPDARLFITAAAAINIPAEQLKLGQHLALSHDNPEEMMVRDGLLSPIQGSRLLSRRLGIQLARAMEDGWGGEGWTIPLDPESINVVCQPSPTLPLPRLIWDGMRSKAYTFTPGALVDLERSIKGAWCRWTPKMATFPMTDALTREAERGLYLQLRQHTEGQGFKLSIEGKAETIALWSLLRLGFLELS